jgi:hypothetical protein
MAILSSIKRENVATIEAGKKISHSLIVSKNLGKTYVYNYVYYTGTIWVIVR